MPKLEKNILHRIEFDKDKLLNETILNLIYQEYKDTEYDTVLILDKSEFKDFLLKYLPIYLEETANE